MKLTPKEVIDKHMEYLCVGAQGIQDSIVAVGAESREGSRDSLGTKYEPPGDKPGERKQATKDLGTKDE